MLEIEGQQSPQLARGEGSLSHDQETGQNQHTEVGAEQSSIWVDRIKQQLQWQWEENDKWLKENAENPEMAKEWGELWKNAETLRDNLGKFSEDDPNIPAGDETKQKLKFLDIVDAFIGAEDKHEIASLTFLLPLVSGGTFEVLNYLGGNPVSPGFGTKLGLVMGTAFASSIEGYNLAKKGAEKLKALIGKNKGIGAGGPHPSQADTGGNKT
jgi:hypothetical protein